MSACHRTTVLLLLASSLMQGKLEIVNPKHLDVPAAPALALFQSTTRIMEKEFNVPGAFENKFHMRLVLGQTSERFTIDDPAGNGTLYLERWNEFKFTATTMRLAVQQLLVPERQQKMLDLIVRRAHEIAPVSAVDLGQEKMAAPQQHLQDDCIGRIANAAVPGVPCRSAQAVRRSGPMPTR